MGDFADMAFDMDLAGLEYDLEHEDGSIDGCYIRKKQKIKADIVRVFYREILLRETDKAFCAVLNNGKEIWFPKSLSKIYPEDKKIIIGEWLANKKYTDIKGSFEAVRIKL